MSRSYKKTPVVNDHKRKTTKDNKRLANRRVRRSKDSEVLPMRGEYKKMTESYDISDYGWRWTRNQAKEEYASGKLSHYIYEHFPTVDSWLEYWAKCCLRK